MDNKNICRFCGAELMPNTNFCVKCGKNNDSQSADVSLAGAGVSKPDRKVRKAVLTAVLIFALLAVAAVVVIVMPVTPKGTYASGNYDECISVSFYAANIMPVGKDVSLFISEDGDGYEPYYGEEYDLNQVRTYTFGLYTVNGAGVKSPEKQYKYTMNVDRPAGLKVSVEPGKYSDYQDVEIKSGDSSVIYYSTDGSTPDENSDLYDTAIHLGQGTTIIKAFAVNSEGTAGDIYEWKYELNLPVPAEVSYSHACGTYYQDFELVLSSDKDADIYYTTDGSEPTVESDRYMKPVKLETGIYTFKAVAVNAYHMSSGVTQAHYAVTLPKFGRFQRTAAADRYYGIIGSDQELVSFDDQLNEEKRFDIYHVSSIYSSGADLYYLADHTLYRLNQADGSGVKIIDMRIDNFVLLDDKIYLEASNNLYAVDLDGNGLKKYKEFHSCKIMGCWDRQLYIWDSGIVYKMNQGEGEPQKAGEADSSKCFVRKNILYYIDSDSNLVCKNRKDGSVSKMIEADSEYYNLDPDFELLNTTDKFETITTSCDDIFVCNNTLYVLERIDDEYAVYYRLTDVTERNVTTSYKWYAVDLNIGNIWDTGIATEAVTVFDSVIIDGSETKNQVVQ